MGSDYGYQRERPVHPVSLEGFQIARTPVTNAQYTIYIKATGHKVPKHWEDDRPPRGRENYPVVNVSWHDAIAYCDWLSEATGKPVALPNEAQWEKAARGDKDRREYPWGNDWHEALCNSVELGLVDTTPVGIFPDGASPYGCLDMTGNVFEWTTSLWGKDKSEPAFGYPYESGSERENPKTEDGMLRVVRGGSYEDGRLAMRCAFRSWGYPESGAYWAGFRVYSVSRQE
jgi:iron(II)-dependent oxidoreductase